MLTRALLIFSVLTLLLLPLACGGGVIEPVSVAGERVELGVKVVDSAGSKVKLSSLVADPSVLVYLPANLKRPTKSATRMVLRPLARSAVGGGFRVVVLFPAGTEAEGAREWLDKRHIPLDAIVWAIDVDGEFARTSLWPERTAALLDSTGAIDLYFPATDNWDDRVGFEPVVTADILARAWQLEDHGPEVDDATQQAAVDVVVATLTGEPADTEAAALGDKLEHPVWVSLFRPGKTNRLRGTATGALGAALVEATGAALDSGGDETEEWRAAAADIRVQIDVTGAPGEVFTTGEKALWYVIEPGVHGVIIRKGDKEGVLLPSEPVSQGLVTPRVKSRSDKHKRILARVCKDGGLKGDCWKDDDVELLRFRSTSFGLAEPGKPAVPMYRGNVLWEGEPTEEQVLLSIRDGGRWLVNTVKEDGKFDYEYYPNSDQGSRGYNIVRHAGSVYGLFEMWELAGVEPVMAEDRDLYLDAAARSIGYVYDSTKQPPNAKSDDRWCLLNDRGRCESGSAALTLLTFLVRPAPEDVDPRFHDVMYRENDDAIMEGLGLTLLDMIDSKGKVWRRYSQALTEDRVDKEPLYYPGESMLALVRFYEKTGDERWLIGARRIAERQMSWYERKRTINPDHWVMQGLYRLWAIDKDERYARNAFNMGRHYASEQYGADGHYGPVWTPFPDYLGAYRRTNDLPRTTRAGSRSEALRAVMMLAWEKGDDATVYEEALLGAARHLMEQQYTERNGYWVPDLARVHGAYPMGVIDNHVRIDNNQHALVGMVGALHVIRRRAGTLEKH